MVAITALQGLETRSVQFTSVTVKKVAASIRVAIQCKSDLTSLEGRRKDAEGAIGGHLQHHAMAITRVDRASCLFDCPPAWADAIAQAYLARTRLGRWIFLGKVFLTLHLYFT
jgi:hypothetical protein